MGGGGWGGGVVRERWGGRWGDGGGVLTTLCILAGHEKHQWRSLAVPWQPEEQDTQTSNIRQ